jgi:putative transposase
VTDLTPEQLVDLDKVGGGDPATSVTDGLDAVDEQLIARLTGKAREGGMALTGEGGLLAQLTKRLVESALDGELTDHLGYNKHDVTGATAGTPATATDPKRC